MDYRIDAADRLVELHPQGALDRHVDAIGVPRLPEHWLGEVIWGWVDGEDVRAVLAALVARARSGHALELRARTRTTGAPRSVAIEIEPLGRGSVALRSRIGGLLKLPLPPLPVERLRVCAWCKRAHVGRWREIEDVVASERLLEQSTCPAITHGICDGCLGKVESHLQLR